jgi:hypothetical protein
VKNEEGNEWDGVSESRSQPNILSGDSLHATPPILVIAWQRCQSMVATCSQQCIHPAFPRLVWDSPGHGWIRVRNNCLQACHLGLPLLAIRPAYHRSLAFPTVSSCHTPPFTSLCTSSGSRVESQVGTELRSHLSWTRDVVEQAVLMPE